MSVGEFALGSILIMLVLGLIVGFMIGYECGKYER